MNTGWLTPVVRIREEDGGTDQYGEPIPGADVETDLPSALFAPGGTSEPVQPGAAPVISTPTLYWPGQHPDVTASDRLRVAGVTYQVDGKPAVWPKGLAVTCKGVTS
jgi:hypothetical protein